MNIKRGLNKTPFISITHSTEKHDIYVLLKGEKYGTK